MIKFYDSMGATQGISVLSALVDACDFWQNGTEIKTGGIVRSSADSLIYAECIAGGITGEAEPVWGTTDGTEINDGSVKWKVHDLRRALTAETADRFSVPRKINGIEFDGSKDITILLPKKIDGEFSGSFEGDFHGKFTGDAPDYILKTNIAAGSLGEIVTTLGKLVAVDADGLLPVNIRGNAGKLAGVNVAVTNPEDGQVLAYRVASNTWTNEARAVVGEGKTLAIYDGDTLLGEYSGGKTVTIDLGTAKIKADVEQDLTKAVEEMKKTIADFFDIDENGSIMPAENPHFSNQFELDNDGAIMPKEAN